MEDLFKRLLYVSDPLMLQTVAPKRLKERQAKRQPIHPNILPLLKKPEQGDGLETDTVSSFVVWPHEEEIMREAQDEDDIVEQSDVIEKSPNESMEAGPSGVKIQDQKGDAKKMSKKRHAPHHAARPYHKALAESSTDESTDSEQDSRQKRKARRLNRD